MRTTIRLLSVAVALLTFAACGGGDKSTGPSAPQYGALIFRQDALSCPGYGTLELYVDGVSQGQYTSGPGAQKSFHVTAGSHTAGAREIGGSNYVFPTQNVNVPANSSFTAILVCQ